jgi:menaquinone-specific isochorismate synthase
VNVRAEGMPSSELSSPHELLRLLPDRRAYAFVHSRGGIVGWGRAARIEVPSGLRRFETTAEALEGTFARIRRDGWSRHRPVAFGSFTFDERDRGSSLVIPASIMRMSADAPSLAVDGRAVLPMPEVDSTADVPRIRYAGSTLSEVDWLDAVDVAVSEIRRGHLEKVVLARDLFVWAKEELDNRLLAARLAHRFPECFVFVHETLVGATPELLVRRTGDVVESLVLAGTARRDPLAHGDAMVGEALLSSEKDGREHLLAVESVTGVLENVCHDLTVDDAPSLLKLANVQHLATRVTGRLSRPLSALELAGRLHPTAAVCGTPRADAGRMIRRLEGIERGRYAGPVGWVDALGDGEFGIALRCAEVHGTRARLFAGAGIVAESTPEAELEETRLKLRAMQSALGDVK